MSERISEQFVKTAVKILDSIETAEAEEKYPKREIPSDYTKLERIIAEMLAENTGCSILDSGSIYGRHFEKNRAIKDFREIKPISIKCYSDGEYIVSLDLFHFLVAHLDVDESTDELNKSFDEMFWDNKEYDRYSPCQLSEEFVDYLENEGFKRLSSFNTYECEYSLLSQVLQGIFFENGKDTYVILQIHNGCDIRGGYTKPRVFKLATDLDYFWIDQMSFIAHCKCTHYSFDGGDHFINGDYVEERVAPKHWKANSKTQTVKCESCKRKVIFATNY